jgi:ElaB/YqjD/DUF883 family membrane-anchored ribosome-binding protein
MNTYETQQDELKQETTLWEQADEMVRENPIPVIFTAVAIGFGLGLLFRLFDTESRSHPIRDCLDETSDMLGSIWRPISKKSRRTARSVRDAVAEAVDRAQDIDVDPITRWWRRLW